jgi:heme A synthase
MAANDRRRFKMLTAIRSSHRRTTPITRVTAALAALPHPHRKRQHHAGAAAIVSAVVGLVAVLIGTAAVMSREKLASIVSRGDRGEEQALDATKE